MIQHVGIRDRNKSGNPIEQSAWQIGRAFPARLALNIVGPFLLHLLFAQGAQVGSRSVVSLELVPQEKKNGQHDTGHEQNGDQRGDEAGERGRVILGGRTDVGICRLNLWQLGVGYVVDVYMLGALTACRG